MNIIFKLCVAAATLAVTMAEVVHLTPETFDEHVNGDNNMLVEFYAPWCGHCKSLEPEWKIAGETFKSEDDIVIAAFDATLSQEIAARYGVKGYPTIKYFPKGDVKTPEDYQGGRTADAIIKWVNDKVGTSRHIKSLPSAVVALDTAGFDKHVEARATLVEFYAPWCGHCKSLAPVYEDLGRAFAGDKNVLIAKVDATEHEELGRRFDIKGFPTIKFFPAGSLEPVDYEEGRDLGSLLAYVNKHGATLKRAKDGSLEFGVGQIEVINDLIIKRSGVVDHAFLDALEAIASNYEQGSTDYEHAQLYINIAMKVLAKGPEYVANELARITKILSGESVMPSKRIAFQLKHNIISAYHMVAVSVEEK